MQNIEFKAELRHPEAAKRQCTVLKAQFIGTLRQTDTYYKLPDGRLKKRQAPGEPTEWIFYHRPNRVSPAMSNFTILSDEQARRRWGTHSLREWLQIKKTRDLWMLENVRIHLDEVKSLGRFIEFEAKVGENYGVKECQMIVSHLRETFGPTLGEPVAVSYSDLMDLHLRTKQTSPPPLGEG